MKVERGTPIHANGFDGVYVREYIAPHDDGLGMHEVRLPGGVTCISGESIEVKEDNTRFARDVADDKRYRAKKERERARR